MHLDNYRHAPRRRLDLVRARFPAARLLRPAKIRGCKRSGRRGRLRSFRVQGAEAFEPASAALPNRATLLVEGSPARSVFLSFGPHDDRVSHRAGYQLLSLTRRCSAVPGAEHCSIAHRAGHALPQRRSRRNGFGRSVRLRFDYRFRLDGPRLELCSPFTSKLAAWCDLTARRGMPRDYFYQ